ncbi:hypothetical protein RvY_07897 [Ramazzottius varieornatus]|uniref:Uncharacterized protein n=1 Tax=Ramazzottius varieornatus TaxID=947166 RepID=A0A1D1V6Q6_RAMVA|nr:hypothetical protein RvY_07897 [Ramazzottius varieornatus]
MVVLIDRYGTGPPKPQISTLFLPDPIRMFSVAGSGMRIHRSFWNLDRAERNSILRSSQGFAPLGTNSMFGKSNSASRQRSRDLAMLKLKGARDLLWNQKIQLEKSMRRDTEKARRMMQEGSQAQAETVLKKVRVNEERLATIERQLEEIKSVEAEAFIERSPDEAKDATRHLLLGVFLVVSSGVLLVTLTLKARSAMSVGLSSR